MAEEIKRKGRPKKNIAELDAQIQNIVVNEITTKENIKPSEPIIIERTPDEIRKEIIAKSVSEIKLEKAIGSFEDVLQMNGWKLVRADQFGSFFIRKNTGDVLADWIYKDGILSAKIDVSIDTRKSKFMIKNRTLFVV